MSLDNQADAEVWLRGWIESVDWQFAKTYAKTAPHEYTIRQWRPDNQVDFEQAATIIFKYGFKHNYYSKQMTYLTIDGWRYWPMDEPSKTDVINRAKNELGWQKLYQSQSK